MKIIADLHLHSFLSDGIYTPKHLIQIATKNNLKAISITDHDTATEYSNNEIEMLIPGVEFSAYYDNKSVHILGYFKSVKGLKGYFDEIKEKRLLRIYKMIDCLKKRNIVIYKEDIDKMISNTNTPGRPHLARIIQANGYVSNIQEAFELYLSDNSPCYIKKQTVSIEQTIDTIHQYNGIAVLAHPVKSSMEKHIDKFVKMGLDGVEIFVPNTPVYKIDMLLSIAKEYNMIITGGSDYHGDIEYVPYGLNENYYEIFLEEWRNL